MTADCTYPACVCKTGELNPCALLHHLTATAERKHHAAEEYRQALIFAHEAGHSYADLARAVGCSRQNIREQLTRTPKPTA